MEWMIIVVILLLATLILSLLFVGRKIKRIYSELQTIERGVVKEIKHAKKVFDEIANSFLSNGENHEKDTEGKPRTIHAEVVD